VRRSNARSGRSFAFKAIISKRVDYRSPADEASTPAAASLTRRTRSTAVAARSETAASARRSGTPHVGTILVYR